ncbi:MAG: hypothetical protein IKJ69_00355 [Clostridia bacterium]|nr:hypothetical protein [Clostridia bacterium]
MKESIIKAVTAIICTASLCITSNVAVSNYSDAVKEAAKLTGSVFVEDNSVADESTDTPESNDTDITTEDSTDTVTDPTVDNETEEVTQADTTDVTDSKTEPTKKADSEMTVDEIVKLFNESANKIKTDAKKVVKNYEKRIVNEDKLELPAGLEGTAKSMISTFMSDDTEPIVYSTKEDIRNEYIVPEQDYVSKLQPSTVLNATCTDKGSTYEIYFKLKDEKNPRAGSGVAAACDVIEPHEVSEKVSFIKRFDATYYNCEIKATIDKATGRMTHTLYSTPVVLDITVNLFGTHDAKAGFTFVKDYTITY